MKEHSTSSLKTGSLKKSKLLRALISLIVCISIITLYIPVSLTVEAETEEEQVSFGNEQAKDDEDKTEYISEDKPAYDGEDVREDDDKDMREYDGESLEEIIRYGDNGGDLDHFFWGSIYYGLSLEDLKAYKVGGNTMEDIMSELSVRYAKADQVMDIYSGMAPDIRYIPESPVVATGSDASGINSISDTSRTSIISEVVPISSESLKDSMSALGCNYHGRINKLIMKSETGNTEAFCIDIGMRARTGDKYSCYKKDAGNYVYGKVYYWYFNNRNDNAYAAASLFYWVYSSGVKTPKDIHTREYAEYYNNYYKAAVDILGNDTMLDGQAVKKYIGEIVTAANSGNSCSVYYWKNPNEKNQRLITGNYKEKVYHIKVNKCGLYGKAVMDVKLPGAEFGVYSENDCSNRSLLKKYVTDSEGQFYIDLLSDGACLYMKEIKAPKGYKINETVYKLFQDTGSIKVEDQYSDVGRFGIKKTDSENGQPVNDAGSDYRTSGCYILYSDSNCTEMAKDVYGNNVRMFVSRQVHDRYWESKKTYGSGSVFAGNDGYVYSGILRTGTYYLKETQAPAGYYLNPDMIKVVITAGGSSVKNALKIDTRKTSDIKRSGGLGLSKHVADTYIEYDNVEGAVYKLYAATDIKTGTGNIKERAYVSTFPETNEMGYAELTGILPGKYYIVEETAPEGLYNASDSAIKPLEYDEQGNIVSDITVENAADYGVVVTEVNESDNQVDVYDEAKKYKISLDKTVDGANGEKLPLADAGFMLFDRDKIEAYIKADSEPENIAHENNENGNKKSGIPVNEDECPDYGAFAKEDWDRFLDAAVVLKGKETIIYTDEKGHLETDIIIPYGKYVLVEYDVPLNSSGFEYIKAIEPVNISFPEACEEGQYEYKLSLNDEKLKVRFNIVKYDGDTLMPIEANSCRIRLINKETEEAVTDSATGFDYFSTDEKGYININGNMEPGVYYLEELEAPEGYALLEDKMLIRVRVVDGKTEIGIYDQDKEDYVDEVSTGSVNLTGDEVSPGDGGIEQNGAEPEIHIYNVRYKLDIRKIDDAGEPVENAVLGLYPYADNSEDIKDVDNVKGDDNTKNDDNIKDSENTNDVNHKIFMYTNYEELSNVSLKDDHLEIITGTEKTEISGLPEGTYILREIKAPDGYMKSEDIVINIGNDKTQETITSGQIEYSDGSIIVNMVDVRCGRITLNKTGDLFTDFKKEKGNEGEYYRLITSKLPLGGAVFGIFDGEHNKICEITSGDDGTCTSDYLPYGEYYIKELAAPDGYIANDREIPVSLYEECVDLSQTADIYNEYRTINISLEKKIIGESGDKMPLKGAVFAVYNENEINISGKEIPKESCLGFITTDDKGKGIYSGKLPVGSYYVKEVKTLDGYVLDTYKYQVNYDGNSDGIFVLNNGNDIMNYSSGGKLCINKLDAQGDTYLKGAEFTVYNKENDKKVLTLITDDKGYAEANIPNGDYYMMETKSPEGYIKDETRQEFTIDNDNTTAYYNMKNDRKVKLGVNEIWYIAASLGSIFIIIMFMLYVFVISRKKNVVRKNEEK